MEIEPIRPSGGRIVWEWHAWDHLIQNHDRAKPNYGDPAAHPELISVDCNGRAIPAFWNHMNSLDYNAKVDQISLSVRGCNEIWIIDHGTTTKEAAGHSGGKRGKGGDLLYRWGNPAAYGRGTEADKQLVQQHDGAWIPDGYPGAGHLMIFNNGYDRGWSSIEEIAPPMDAQGRYLLEAGKTYGPERPVWHYEAKNRTDFFSSEISGAHRLPNGNTIVCAGVVGHLFEITQAGEMVWQYVNPMVRGGILAQGELPGKDVRGHLFNAVFKVHRYAPDYAGLAGRTLAPQGVIELPASQKGKTGLDQAGEESLPRPGNESEAGMQGRRMGGGSRDEDAPPPGERGMNDPGNGPRRSDQDERGGRPPGGGGRDLGRGPLSEALDANGDGVLSSEEMKNAAIALKALDKNGDGKLSGSELSEGDEGPASPDGRPRRPGGPLMRVLDTDRDEALSSGEIANAPAALAAADANKDGKLTREEVDAAGGGGPGRGRGGQGGERGAGGPGGEPGPRRGGPRPQSGGGGRP